MYIVINQPDDSEHYDLMCVCNDPDKYLRFIHDTFGEIESSRHALHPKLIAISTYRGAIRVEPVSVEYTTKSGQKLWVIETDFNLVISHTFIMNLRRRS